MLTRHTVCALVCSLSVLLLGALFLRLVTRGSLLISKFNEDLLSVAGFSITMLALVFSFGCAILVFSRTVDSAEDIVERRLSNYFDSPWRQRPKQT